MIYSKESKTLAFVFKGLKCDLCRLVQEDTPGLWWPRGEERYLLARNAFMPLSQRVHRQYVVRLHIHLPHSCEYVRNTYWEFLLMWEECPLGPEDQEVFPLNSIIHHLVMPLWFHWNYLQVTVVAAYDQADHNVHCALNSVWRHTSNRQ